MGDVEDARIRLRAMMSTPPTAITDSANANKIVHDLGNRDVQILVQHYPDIQHEIQKRFAVGIPANSFANWWDTPIIYKQ